MQPLKPSDSVCFPSGELVREEYHDERTKAESEGTAFF